MAVAGDRALQGVSRAGVLLDVTRTVSRAGLGAATGIDRVERRWIDEALKGRWGEAAFVARLSTGLHHLNAEAMQTLLAMLDGEAPPPRPDLRGALSLVKRPALRRIESAVRRMAGAGGGAAVYANVGHSNLSPGSIAEARRNGAERAVVLIHDTIPLEYPEYARPDGPSNMQVRLDEAATADAVAEAGGGTVRPVLARTRPTPAQGSLAGRSRRANVSGAFRVRRGQPLELFGLSVWLVDDVVTSGATVEECARALGEVGARRVSVLCLARAGEGDADAALEASTLREARGSTASAGPRLRIRIMSRRAAS